MKFKIGDLIIGPKKNISEGRIVSSFLQANTHLGMIVNIDKMGYTILWVKPLRSFLEKPDEEEYEEFVKDKEEWQVYDFFDTYFEVAK